VVTWFKDKLTSRYFFSILYLKYYLKTFLFGVLECAPWPTYTRQIVQDEIENFEIDLDFLISQVPDVVMSCLPPCYHIASALIMPPFLIIATDMSNPHGNKSAWDQNMYVHWNLMSPSYLLFMHFQTLQTMKLWAMFEQFSQKKSRSGLSANEQLMRLNEQFPKFSIWCIEAYTVVKMLNGALHYSNWNWEGFRHWLQLMHCTHLILLSEYFRDSEDSMKCWEGSGAWK